MTIKIQKATPQDAYGMRQVLHQTWLATYPNDEYKITREDIEYAHRDYFNPDSISKLQERLNNIPDTELRLVAKDEDNNSLIVGVSLMRKEESNNRLQMLYVLPEYQGKGIGSSLWNELKKFCDPDKEILVNVAVYNKSVIAFYENLGFKDTGKRFQEENFKMRNGYMIPEMEMRIASVAGTQKEILFATQNDAKVKIMQSILGNRYKVVTPRDLGIKFQVEEDGVNPKENALKKARYCFQNTKKATLSTDFGFFIEGLNEARQPGASVKRIIPISKIKEPSDEEILEFYKNLVNELGGKADAYWIHALAYVSKDGEFSKEIKVPKKLVNISSEKRLKGFPLVSIQIDPITGKYESELTDEERAFSHKTTDDAIRLFVEQHV